MRHEPQIFTDITLAEVHDLAAAYKAKGWRFVALSGSLIESSGQIELIYSYSEHDQLENRRLLIQPDQAVPSVSDIFFNALVFENEVHDLFGVTITDIAIDFSGKFYNVREPVPMNPELLPTAMSNFTVKYRDTQGRVSGETPVAVPDAAAPDAPAAGNPANKKEGGN